MGGMCARVCPTETLCEEACVREAAEGKPVRIGMLQRYATDTMMATGKNPFARGPLDRQEVAVVGAGPAGLSCAHELAHRGHDVTVFEARTKAAGLNEYGIAAYKTPDGFAQKEVEFILVDRRHRDQARRRARARHRSGRLRRDYDAVFLGLGLARSTSSALPARRRSTT